MGLLMSQLLACNYYSRAPSKRPSKHVARLDGEATWSI